MAHVAIQIIFGLTTDIVVVMLEMCGMGRHMCDKWTVRNKKNVERAVLTASEHRHCEAEVRTVTSGSSSFSSSHR